MGQVNNIKEINSGKVYGEINFMLRISFLHFTCLGQFGPLNFEHLILINP